MQIIKNMTRLNVKYPTNVYYLLILLLIIGSCSPKVYSVEESPLLLLENQIALHRTIRVSVDGKDKHVQRSVLGQISNTNLDSINSFLSTLNSDYMNKADFMFVSYYPGEDECNSSGVSTRDDIGESNKKLKKKIKKLKQVADVGIYKTNDGITRWDKHLKYFEDQNHLVSRTFFKLHYPCSSYLILHKSGKYYSYFGESWTEKKLLDLDLFVRSINGGYL